MRRILAGAVALGLGLLSPAAAVAHDGEETLKLVRPDLGPPLYTHGVDTRGEMSTPVTARAVSGEIGFSPGSAERRPVCASGYASRSSTRMSAARNHDRRGDRPDPPHRRAHGRGASTPSRSPAAAPTPTTRCSATRPAQVRVGLDHDHRHQLLQVVAAARAAGYNTNRADYVVFLDNQAGGACGIASYDDDETLSIDNKSNMGGGYGIIYQPCWDGETPMHESGPPDGRGPVQRPELDRQRRPLLRGGRRHVLLARRRRHQPEAARRCAARARRASTATSTTTSTPRPSPASTSRPTGTSARR